MKKHTASFTAIVILGMILTLGGCGKKGPPVLPQRAFEIRVIHLRGEWKEGYVDLRGDFSGAVTPRMLKDEVLGCRVYYAQYPIQNPPCADCPIEYQGYHALGPEVATEKGFHCRIPSKDRERVYFFKVHLIGKEETLGPPSDRVQITVK